MSNDLKIKLPTDRRKIDLNEPGEFIWWSNHLGIGLEKLLSAVKVVGPEAALVRKHIHERKQVS
jgi:hypothetical protein